MTEKNEFDAVFEIVERTRAAYAVLNQVHTNPTFLFSLEGNNLICREKGYKANLLLSKTALSEYIDCFTFAKKEWDDFLRHTAIIDETKEDGDFYYGYQEKQLIFRIQKTNSARSRNL